MTGDTVLSSEVNQQLHTGTEPNAQISISNMQGIHIVNNNDSHDDHIGDGTYLRLDANSGSFDVTYNNLTNTSYNGKKITKLTYHITVSPNTTSNAKNAYTNSDAASKGDKGDNVFSILVSHDPTKGFDIWGVSATVDGTYYYADGTPVTFERGTAYLSVGSLDNYTNVLGPVPGSNDPNGYSIESTTINSGGKAIALAGSTVTVHNGNTLYSDIPNATPNSTLPSYLLPNSNVQSYDGRFGDWDYNNSGIQYVGAGLFQLDGSHFSLTVKPLATGIPSNGQFRNWMWWNATSVIFTTPGPQKPNPITVHYHYDTT